VFEVGFGEEMGHDRPSFLALNMSDPMIRFQTEPVVATITISIRALPVSDARSCTAYGI